MNNFTVEELEQLRTLTLFHIGYLSEMVSNLETEIKNAQSQVEESKNEYLNQVKEIKDTRLNQLDEYKNIYSKLSNLKKECITNNQK